jgi:hypothetical protein
MGNGRTFTDEFDPCSMGGVGKTSLAITRGRGGPMAAKGLPSFTPRLGCGKNDAETIA